MPPPYVHISYIQSTNLLTEYFEHVAQSPFFSSPKNVIYFIMLPSVSHKIFTFYIKSAVKFKCPALETKG